MSSMNATPKIFGAELSQQIIINYGSVSEATYNLVEDTSVRGFLIFGVLSVFFSVTNACVYFQQRRSAFAVYLMGVNFGDGLYSATELVQSLSVIVLPTGSFTYRVIGLYFYSYLATSFSRAAITLNALASLERFVVVAFPLKMTKTCLQHISPVVVVIFAFSGSLVGHSYLLCEYGLRPVPILTGNATDTVWTAMPTVWKSQNLLAFEIAKNTSRVTFTYIPLFTSLLMNVCLAIALARHVISRRALRTARGGVLSARKKEASEKKNSETQTTKLILVFTFTFLFLNLPSVLNSTLSSILPSYGVFKTEHFLFWVIARFFLILTHFTEIVQFAVCFSYSQQYRAAFFKLLLIRILRIKYTQKQHFHQEVISGITSLDKTIDVSSDVTDQIAMYNLSK